MGQPDMTKRNLHLTFWGLAAAGLLSFLVGFTYSVVSAAEAPAAPLPLSRMAEAASPGDVANVKPLEMFAETLEVIRSHYRLADTVQWRQEKREQELMYAGLDGLLRSLGDPYTRFLRPEAYREMIEQNRGHFDGIGAYLKLAQDGKHVLLAPIPGGPAERAGMKVGDVLLKINDTDAVGMSTDKARDLIRGKAGTTVQLTIGRPADSAKPVGPSNPLKQIRLVVMRDQIKPEEIEFKIGPPGGHEKEEDIGYIHLKQFNEDTENQLDRALAQITRKKVKGVVLDLRGNPGGLLDSAIAVASRFVEGGPVVLIQESGGNRRTHRADTSRYQRLNCPVVVLVNGGSASASEIVAGALRDRGVAKIIGETTFGKGLVQTIIPLDGNGTSGALKITTAKYFTPNGIDINHKGIKPDFEVPMREAIHDPFATAQKQVDDVQLTRAIEVLRQQAKGGARVADNQ